MSVAAVGGAIVGGVLAGDASSKASKAQTKATQLGIDEEKRQYDLTRADNLPFLQAGTGATNMLSMLLGVPGGGAKYQGLTRDQIREELLPSYSKKVTAPDPYAKTVPQRLSLSARKRNEYNDWMKSRDSMGILPKEETIIDTAGLNAAIEQRLAEQEAKRQAEEAAYRANPQFGALTKNFTMADFETDPGYQFRMDEGSKALTNSATARGGVLSGAAAKAMERFSQGLASQEYGNAFNRFNANQDKQFNRLATLAGVGQTATAQVNSAGQNMANNVSALTLAGGQARASGYIGRNNALQDTIGSVYGAGKKAGWWGGSAGANWHTNNPGADPNTGFVDWSNY